MIREAAVLEGEVRPASERNANVPAELDAISKKALAHDPADRYQSAKVMAAEISAVLDDGLSRDQRRDRSLSGGRVPPEQDPGPAQSPALASVASVDLASVDLAGTRAAEDDRHGATANREHHARRAAQAENAIGDHDDARFARACSEPADAAANRHATPAPRLQGRARGDASACARAQRDPAPRLERRAPGDASACARAQRDPAPRLERRAPGDASAWTRAQRDPAPRLERRAPGDASAWTGARHDPAPRLERRARGDASAWTRAQRYPAPPLERRGAAGSGTAVNQTLFPRFERRDAASSREAGLREDGVPRIGHDAPDAGTLASSGGTGPTAPRRSGRRRPRSPPPRRPRAACRNLSPPDPRHLRSPRWRQVDRTSIATTPTVTTPALAPTMAPAAAPPSLATAATVATPALAQAMAPAGPVLARERRARSRRRRRHVPQRPRLGS